MGQGCAGTRLLTSNNFISSTIWVKRPRIANSNEEFSLGTSATGSTTTISYGCGNPEPFYIGSVSLSRQKPHTLQGEHRDATLQRISLLSQICNLIVVRTIPLLIPPEDTMGEINTPSCLLSETSLSFSGTDGTTDSAGSGFLIIRGSTVTEATIVSSEGDQFRQENEFPGTSLLPSQDIPLGNSDGIPFLGDLHNPPSILPPGTHMHDDQEGSVQSDKDPSPPRE
ncbi:hypothetical protein KIL84_003819 [Mauremys mutica]|uniref:Uncharacterized protein n=1 Tax=Mauremys mutica TaxID=74926 RepID=A0A9D3WUX8_9SAUR|nr:hypothetical protein KIL84_003819 [Mauremys mutica]